MAGQRRMQHLLCLAVFVSMVTVTFGFSSLSQQAFPHACLPPLPSFPANKEWARRGQQDALLP